MIKKTCSFCDKTYSQVANLIKGKEEHVYICDECIELASKVINNVKFGKLKNFYPQEIKQKLDEYVIGQEQAKKVLAVAAYNHYKRLILKDDVDKSNILMLGPTGSGKTYLLRILSKILDVPLVIADVTSLTEAGFVGDDVENILLQLFQAAGEDIEKAEKGIIYLDEIDKISKRGDSVSLSMKDPGGEGVQQALLKIVEGTVASFPINGGRKHPNQKNISINTKNILFVAGGAFSGIEEITNKRLKDTFFSVGFTSKETSKQTEDPIIYDDLKQYGLIPEFIGRFSSLVSLSELNKEELIEVLTKPKRSIISQFMKIFELEEIDLEFTPDALTKVADLCIKRKIGARGLRSVIDQTLLEIQYNLGQYKEQNVEKIIITDTTIDDKIPVLIYANKIQQNQ